MAIKIKTYNFTLVDGGDRAGGFFLSGRGASPEAAFCNAIGREPDLLRWNYECVIWYDKHGNQGYVDKNYPWLPVQLEHSQ